MLFDESKHPRDDSGKFTDGIGKAKKIADAERIYNSEPLTIELPDEIMPHSLSAKWANEDIRMPDGKDAHFVEGSKLHHKEVFAGRGTKTPIRDVERLVKKYGGKAEDWQKIKGFGSFELNGKSFEGEIHWYEEPSVGRKEIKFKER